MTDAPDAPDESLGQSTLLPSNRGGPRARADVPCLTIAWHPRHQRVGERARLMSLAAGGELGVSRLVPDFATVAGERVGPLRDAHLSRKPVRLIARDGSIEIDPTATSTTVSVSGQPCSDRRLIPQAEVERGVVLELAGSVVLVLHYGRPTGDAAATDSEVTSSELIGASDRMVDLRAEIARVGPEPLSVLLRGESGSGKELVARALHAASPRADGPLVAVNMAAVPSTTAASELFGHERGAFTGAVAERTGLFGEANHGTLFLDEVGETPAEVQAMLLRTLETGEVRRVGASRVRRVDVRLIAATDAELELAVAEERFKLPLLHRLGGYEIQVPRLRQRREDIGRLLLHFLRAELAGRGRSEKLAEPSGRDEPWLSASLVARLCAYDWPGNVRQLLNIARQIVVTSASARYATFNPAVERLLSVPAPPAAAAPTEPVALARAEDAPSARTDLDGIADDVLISALRANEWRIAASARALGISKTSLYQLMDRCAGIQRASELSEQAIRAAGEDWAGDVRAMARALEVSRRGLQLRMRQLGLSE